jgi:hypothetical protein
MNARTKPDAVVTRWHLSQMTTAMSMDTPFLDVKSVDDS